MIPDYELTKTLVDDRQRDLARQASRWSLARLAGRHRHARRQAPSRRAASAGL